MNVTDTTSSQQLAFDGPLSFAATLLFAAGLVAIFAWSLYRERFILGTRTTIAFGCLRLIGLGTVLWMLLAPTNVLVETSTTKRSIAIMTDTSGSMTTVDPPGVADELRWNTKEDLAAPTATSYADRALAALGVATYKLEAAIKAIAEHRSDQQIAERISSTELAIASAKANVGSIRELNLSTLMTSEHAAAVEPALKNSWQTLGSPEFEEFATLANRLAAGRSPAQADWRESLGDLQHRVTGTRQVINELSRLLAIGETEKLTSTTQASRIDLVGDCLNQLKLQTLDSFHNTADVRWSHFDRKAEAMNDIASPKNTLQQIVQTASKQQQESSEDATLATNLSAALDALRSAEGQTPLAAAFVFSDMAHNDPGTTTAAGMVVPIRTPTEIAASLHETPVYMIPIGNPQRLRDVNLVGVDAPTVAMRNDDIVIEAYLEAYQCPGERCVVQLIEDGEVLDFREVEFDSDFATRTVRFQRRVAEIGQTSFQISVSGLDGEMTAANNLHNVGISVTRNQIKVLLADEAPRWEYRYLAQLFRRDAKIQCDEMLFHPRLIATGKRESSRTFPTTTDEWDEYDVVILGDLPPEHLPVAAQESLIQYVNQRGGTVILIAGSTAMPQAYVDSPIAEILPVTKASEQQTPDAGYAFRATQVGSSHVAMMIGETLQATQAAWEFVNRFSPLDEVSLWRRPKPTAKNLIAVVPRSADGQSVVPSENAVEQDSFLCWQPIGRGRVVYLSGPDTYRLRFLRGDRYHYRFWGQMLRWAIAADMGSGSSMARIRMDKTEYKANQTVNIELRLADADGSPISNADDMSMKVTAYDSESIVALTPDPEQPGLYRAEIESPRVGVYQIQPVGSFIDSLPEAEAEKDLSVTFTVIADIPLELADTRCNRVLATQVSEMTGGQVLPPTAIAEVLALTDLTPVVTSTTRQTPLWTQWKYLWMVFGCLQIEWIVRKWRGLS